MSTMDNVHILPTKEEMLSNLLVVSKNSYYKEKFYPMLLEHCEQEKVVLGVVNAYTLAVHDFLKTFDQPFAQTITIMHLNSKRREFLQAMCPTCDFESLECPTCDFESLECPTCDFESLECLK
jgi:hypothetical protein